MKCNKMQISYNIFEECIDGSRVQTWQGYQATFSSVLSSHRSNKINTKFSILKLLYSTIYIIYAVYNGYQYWKIQLIISCYTSIKWSILIGLFYDTNTLIPQIFKSVLPKVHNRCTKIIDYYLLVWPVRICVLRVLLFKNSWFDFVNAGPYAYKLNK